MYVFHAGLSSILRIREIFPVLILSSRALKFGVLITPSDFELLGVHTAPD